MCNVHVQHYNSKKNNLTINNNICCIMFMYDALKQGSAKGTEQFTYEELHTAHLLCSHVL